ncbi:MAG: ATP-dependent DNA helicase RecG [Sphaerochaetaceae bacterium]
MFVREWNKTITTLKGVGKQLATSYANLGIFTYRDLLLFAPRTYEDRTRILPLGNLTEEPIANTIVEVISHTYFGYGKKRTLKVIVSDISGEGDGRAALLCFGRNFLERTLRIGGHFYLYGQFQRNRYEWQTSQFEMLPLKADGTPTANFGRLLPIYPLSLSLTQRIIRRDVATALKEAPQFNEELPQEVLEQYNLLPINSALEALHTPKDKEEAALGHRTLSFIELFYLFILNRRGRGIRELPKGEPFPLSRLQQKFIASLPFKLTKDQGKVLAEICYDLKENSPMNRLLQGDVGSGKTLIAWLSALQIIQEGKQVAFMAPTELLARQHAEMASQWLTPLGVNIAFLTGSVKGNARKLLLEALSKGEIDIIIGTHALFSDEVKFSRLAYVIIDEQQRFGVLQRISLLEKGRQPAVLMMSATPIPRSLALTVYGDLNISTIKTMPLGRKPVTTYLVADRSRERMYNSIGVEFSRGHQAYFVYPRIDDQGTTNLRNTEGMFKYLSTKIYPGISAALIHSRLPEEEKVDILRRFREKEITYLVSTSVVEVGIDIPNATCMVVEHADRFGLSALHQLRGRVGRSSIQSYCFLVYDANLSEDGVKRLKVMKESNDGFYIAEQDLLIRGPGEVAGTRQSGFLKLRFASLTENFSLIEEVKECVDAILSVDNDLLKRENSVIREVLTQAPPFDDKVMEG